MCSALLTAGSVYNVYVQHVLENLHQVYLMVLSLIVRSRLARTRSASAFQHCGQLQGIRGKGWGAVYVERGVGGGKEHQMTKRLISRQLNVHLPLRFSFV